MDKNENGYPVSKCGLCDRAERREGCCCCNNGQDQAGEYSCGGDGSCLDGMKLAYVYAPNQHFRMLYSADEALKHGTLFEELYKPMGVYGNE